MLEFMLHLRFCIGVHARLRKDSVLRLRGNLHLNPLVIANHPFFHTGLPDGPKSYRSPFSSGSPLSNNSPSSMGGALSNNVRGVARTEQQCLDSGP